MPRALAAFIAVIVLCFGIALASASGDSPRPAPVEHRAPVTEPLVDRGAQLLEAQGVVEYGQAIERQAVGSYIFSVEMGGVVAYTQAVARADLAIYLASIPRPAPARPQYRAPVPAPSAPSTGGGGGACGGAGNADQFIQRESGGDPTIANGGGHAANPFEAGRAWGCYQILPSTWASACGVGNSLGLPPITTYDPASQAQCAARLPASAWASSGPTG